MAIKLGKVMTYHEGLPLKKILESLGFVRSCDIKYFVSVVALDSWPPNMRMW